MKFLKVFFSLALAAAVFTFAADLSAKDQPKEQPKGKMKCEDHFASMDTNKDGKVSLEEFKAAKPPCHEGKGHMGKGPMMDKGAKGEGQTPEEIFKSMDANNDGFLTIEECKAKCDKEGKCKKHEMGEKSKKGEKSEKGKKSENKE